VLRQRLSDGIPWLAALVCVGVVLAPQSDSLLHELGHHGLHIGLVLGAFAIFLGAVARDIARNGWPTFSWRL